MNRQKKLSSKWSIAAAAVGLIALAIVMFGPLSGQDARVLITQAIDESNLVTLVGNTRPEAKNPQNDRGPVPDDFLLDHMLLQLKRSPAMEAELVQYIEQLTDKSSPNLHHWILAKELGEKYGPSQQDLDTIKSWLESKGFTVFGIQPNRMVMDISATAAEIREAFHTEIHYLEVNGQTHFANMSDPKIPAALSPAVVGVVSMHNFVARPMLVPRVDHPVTENDGFDRGSEHQGPNEPRAFYTTGNTSFPYTVVPADFQTIYNLVPLYKLGISGTGQTVTLVEDSDTYSSDVSIYRHRFLSRWSGTFSTTHPSGSAACTDPGATAAADGEADLDAEVASAIAPNAAIVAATCADTTTTGVLLAIENLVNAGTPPAIISMSYGECEALNGTTSNAAFYTAFQTGSAAGVSIFASSGDLGAAQCANGYANYATYAETGIGVTGWGETPYNVSVGGTDFEDTFNASKGTAPNNVAVTTYWNATNFTPTLGSAKSYIPEIPWNNSCAGEIFVLYESKITGYGSSGACTLVTPSTAAAGGGPSGCATLVSSDATSYGAVDGTCTGYPKPSWQSGIFGNPADGVRDIPDVSMFASNGWWGHFTVICWSDTTNGGASCSGAPNTWSGFGGTSVATPVMASIQALVNERWGTTWQGTSPRVGNPAPVYYTIANAEFGGSGNSACYSINQLSQSRRGIASSCAFYDITQGDNNIDCEFNGTTVEAGCYKPSGTYGAISTQALATTGTVTAVGSGYTSAPICTIGKPSDLNTYLQPITGASLWGGGTAATCTATISSGKVSAITVSSGSTGYAGGASCTLTGGGGTGATCSVSPLIGTTPASWQPAYGATPGWDFATGLGSVNAYNLVLNKSW
ncbi:MAG: protease pro-enzyme activation domain-containing protein [Bryobacteraceae bacterium]|jgi:subtilase family serine protease